MARVLLWVVLAVWGLFALTLGAIHLVIVPRIDDARPALERWASKALGVPFKVASIQARAERSDTEGLRRALPNLVPSFELRDVRLFDPAGREALRLPEVQVAVSVRSLWRLGFERLVIDSPTLDVRRTADNRIEVAGLDFSGPGSEDNRAANWFFDQSEFLIRNGTVRWTDDLRGQPPLALSDVDLLVRNARLTHAFQLDATPPPEWGERASLRGRLREPLLDLSDLTSAAAGRAPWHNWGGELYADFAKVDVSRLQTYVDLAAWGVSLRSGQGALRAWGDVSQGRLDRVTTDLALNQIATQLGPQLPELAIDTLSGRVVATLSDNGFEVASNNLQFRTSEGLDWPASALSLKHQRAQGQQAATSVLSADRVELGSLAAIATRLPLPDPGRALLLKLNPTGRLEAIKADWQGAAPSSDGSASADAAAAAWQPHRYRAAGRVVGLGLAGELRAQAPGEHILPGRPGIRGAQVDFDFNQDGGHADIFVSQGALELPGVFDEPLIPLDRLSTGARWQIAGERIDVWLDKLKLANADTEGSADAHWHTSDPAASPAGSRFPGVLDLKASLSRGVADRVHRYLPIAIGPLAQRYVREAVRGGAVGPVDFRIQGELWDVPFNHPGSQGEFRIAAQLKGVDFDYVPAYLQTPGDAAWPMLRGVNGQLVLDRASLKLSALEGGLANAPTLRLNKAEVAIADLVHEPSLSVSAGVQGPASEVLGFVVASPVNHFTGQALQRASISGPAQAQFKLQIPLHQPEKTAVQGAVQFEGNDVQIAPDTPLLQRTVGQLTFSERGFQIPAAKAQVYGGELRFSGGMAPGAGNDPARIRFKGQGTASAAGLRAGDLGFVSRLTEQASGSANYQVELAFRAGVPELSVSSDLQGMAVNLPAPLSKTAAEILPLRYETKVLTVAADASGEVPRTDRFFLRLGNPAQPLVNLDYERSLIGPEPRVVRGSIAAGLEAGETVAMPGEGVQANIRFRQIDTDAWERAFSKIAGTAGQTPLAGSAAGDDSASSLYLPTTLAVRADRLLVSGRTFNNVVIGGSREDKHWRANVSADQLNGYLEYRQPVGSGAGSIYARLAKLTLAATATAEVEELLQQPTSMPALDIAVDDFVMAERQLGQVEIQAQNLGRPGRPREWQLTKLHIRVPEARFNAIGNWAFAPDGGTGGAKRTALQMELDVRDAGALLARFGKAGTVRGGQGTIRGSIGWVGSPMSLDYPSLAGQLNLDIKTGQFLKVEPGAAKLLGVLSLQSLPRRLVLDFRDVFSEGFAFDFVRGDATIEQGVARTNNLQMKGVNAAALMEGSADIARETQDLKVVVVPEINAGTAALIATAINPAIGLGTFLAQYLLGQPIQSATTQEFRVSGQWADPQVVKVDRKAAAKSAPPVAPQAAPQAAPQPSAGAGSP
jgi:uncharacterized protein (TIGR02099 family)